MPKPIETDLQESTQIAPKSLAPKSPVRVSFSPLYLIPVKSEVKESLEQRNLNFAGSTHDLKKVKVDLTHTNDILCVAFCLNSIVATGGSDGAIVFWDFDSGLIRNKVFVSNNLNADVSVTQLVWCVEREILFSASSDGFFHIWNASKAKLLFSQHAFHKELVAISVLQVSSVDHGLLFTADAVGACKVWDVSGLTRTLINSWKESTLIPEPSFTYPSWLRPLLFFQAHEESVVSLDFLSLNGLNFILTASTDCSVKLWTSEGALVGHFGQTPLWKLGDVSTYAAATLSPTLELPILGFKPSVACAMRNGNLAAVDIVGQNFPSSEASQEVIKIISTAPLQKEKLDLNDMLSRLHLNEVQLSADNRSAFDVNTTNSKLKPLLGGAAIPSSGKRIWTLRTKKMEEIPR